MIPYGRQNINQTDIDEVVEVLRSEFLTQGPKVPAFERAVAACSGVKHAVAVNSASSALHLACLALDVGPGDLVWTTPITFVASANCAVYCGAKVDFVDIDAQTYNICPLRLLEKLNSAAKAGTVPKVLIVVHLAGQSCDMAQIHAMCESHGVKIVEDASHAIGSRYKGQPVGNCRYSSVAVFSFHPVKIVTTGEGGVLVTNDAALANRVARLRSHGITRDPMEMTHAPDGPWYYQQLDLGYNYRMTEMQAALGLSQLRRLDQFVRKRHELAQNYDRMLKDLPVKTPWQHPDCYSAYHLYIVRLKLDELAVTQREVFERLRINGIGVNLHYIPLYRQPYYSRDFSPKDFPEAERYYSEAISLPLYPDLTTAQQEHIVSRLSMPIGHQTLF